MNYFIDLYLRGYEIMGIDKKKIEHQIRIREARKKFKEFLREIDVSEVEAYFKRGLEAEIFIDDYTGRLLGPNGNLKWRFEKGNYRYLLMRIPLPKAPPQPTQEQLIQQILARSPPQAKPEHGKIGGISKFLPAYMKPPTDIQIDERLEICRDLYKDKPIEPTIKEAE